MSDPESNDANENHEPHELSATAQAAIERVLASTAPAAPRIDRDRLMFLAGAASATSDLRPPTFDLRLPISTTRSPGPWHWPAATAALAATSLALAIALLTRSAPAERIVYVPQPVELASMPAPARNVPPGPTLSPTSDHRPLIASVAWHRPDATIPQHNYLRSRDVALRWGLDALGTFPSASGEGASAPTYRSLLESLAF